MRLATTLAAAMMLLFTALSSAALARSVEQSDTDKSLSPYFVVTGKKGSVDAMPLKSTRTDVQISGTIAAVQVTQTYKNEGDDTLEAIYVFPGSTRAAVFAMKMTVGDRTIVAEINKKEEARKIYQAAKDAGKTASLLEQKRPNVFQMNVANINPGDLIKVEMSYTELLIPTEGTYEFVYPAVVGPRYTGESDSSDVEKDHNGGFWTAMGFTKEGEGPTYGWDVAVQLAAGMPIKRVMSSSHPIATDFTDNQNSATVSLTNKGAAGTKDFVLQYQLAGKAIQSGLLMFPGDKENFFLAMVQPPEKVEKRQMPKREYIFILDVSGSMHGFPLDTAKTVMKGLFKGLTPEDRFNIMYFSGGSQLLSEKSLPATRENIRKATNATLSMRGGGGTRILNALTRALAMPTPDEFARTFVVVTDGYVSVEPKVFELIKDNLGKASLFAFGIGSSVNRHIINGMARVGMGEPFFVMHGDDAVEKAARFEKYIQAPALTNVKVAYQGFDAYDVEPTSVPDLFASRPVLIFGKYRGKPGGTIKLTGISGSGDYSQTIKVSDYTPDKSNQAIRYLWARHRIASLADINRLRKDDARVAEVTRLGLEYSLMTDYTSFVAVDNRVRNKDGSSTTVKQPTPLPAGVSNNAIGGPKSGASYGMAGLGSGGGGRASGKRYKTRRPMRALSISEDSAAEAPMPATATPAPAPRAEPKDADEEKEAKPAAGTRLRITRSSATGTLSTSEVSKALRRFQAQLNACAAGVSMTSGQLSFELVIDENGRVVSVKLTSDSIGGSLNACVEKTLKRLRLRAAPGGKTTVQLFLALKA